MADTAGIRTTATPAVLEAPSPGANLLADAGGAQVLRASSADVGALRERQRQRRLGTLALLVGPLLAYWWYRYATGNPVAMPAIAIDWMIVTPILFFVALIVILVGSTVMAGRSPHVMYRPDQVEVSFDDVTGIDGVKEEALRSVNLFLAAKTFRTRMGGSARRGLLFEGSPGTGKTHLAKAMAREAGVPFLFVSATSFQSMYYGATARKIRSYFKELRKTARREGGAIGFIEEIDAIAMARGGLSASAMPGTLNIGTLNSTSMPMDCGGLSGLPRRYAASPWGSAQVVNAAITSEGVGGVVNELLVQMQSFDEPTGWQKLQGKLINGVNLYLPPHRQIPMPRTPPCNILLIAATNRADNLDPALLRPGRFDRRLTFEMPDKGGRRALIDAFLTKKAHEAEMDDDVRREILASLTTGYSPARIQHLFDEALVNAVRRGAEAMCWDDVEKARLVEQVGMGQPVTYTDHEAMLIATHEAGHATVAWLVAPRRRLDVLTIIKRKEALGMLAHGDHEEVYTRSKSELTGLVQIAMGGQVAEELFVGDVTTGPGSDLRYATTVAAEMLGSCGMGDSLISYAAVENGAFSDSNLVGRLLADPQGRERLETFLQEQRDTVRALLEDNRHLVAALRDALVDRHELLGREITDVLEAAQAAHDAVSGVRVVDIRTAGDRTA